MAKWALIIGGVVQETTDIDPAGRFHPDLEWVACADSVQSGEAFSGGIFSAVVPLPLTGNALILSQIAATEATITPRRVREAVLGTDGGWLHAADAEIAALRKGLT